MAIDVNSKSPRLAYASRINDRPTGAWNSPNIQHPGTSQARTEDATKAATELADDESGTPSVAAFPSRG